MSTHSCTRSCSPRFPPSLPPSLPLFLSAGDCHIAYILLYAPRQLEIVIDPTEKGGEEEKTETATSTTDRDN